MMIHDEEPKKKPSRFETVPDDLAQTFAKLKTIDLQASNRNEFMWLVAEGIQKVKHHNASYVSELKREIETLEEQIRYLNKQLRAKKSQGSLFD